MKNSIQVFVILMSLLMTTQAVAISSPPDNAIHKVDQTILRTQQTINSGYLRISLDDSLHGFVDSKMCSLCKPIRIIITPDTIAYDNNVKVPLKQAKKRLGRYASIIYDLKTKNISTIRW
jgi:hypothetical protein